MNADSSQHPAASSAVEPKTRRGQASRERIVEAAVASVIDHGVKELRLDEVLAAAGASKSQLYHYFSDRDGLIDAAVAHRCSDFLGRLGEAFSGVTTLDSLAAVLDGFATDYAVHLSGCPIGTLAGELTGGPDSARGTVVEAFDVWEGYLTAALRRIQASGDLGPEHDAGELALALLTALEGGMFLGQVRGSDRPLRVALDSALAHLAHLGPELD